MIRRAVRTDVDALVGLIRDLADFERSSDSVKIDTDQLASALFAESPTVFAHVAEEDGEVLGMVIWFLNYSTWTGHNGIFLEDFYVRPEARGRGIGKALFSELAAIAHRSDYQRIDWSVLNWNETALRFYRSLGSVPMDEWTGYRLSGLELTALSGGEPLAP
jgi:ribosomal protein S18 acetylase RimI-like enzyme